MRLMDLLVEGSADLDRIKKMFIERWNKIMRPKSRKTKIDYIEKLVNDTLTKDEVRFLIIQLQRKR